MPLSTQQHQIIKRCQKSVVWFLRNFGHIRHPSAGILKFDPFKYQINAIRAFREHRFNIFRKCRQSGLSTISGAFALWFAMFHTQKTILIISRTDLTAMDFLRQQVQFLFEHLPVWMKELWKPVKQNEHEITFPNGSKIKSLTSHPDVLRSNASSLNIIDEAAFIQDMEGMWAGGFSTLQHGGSVIIVSTCNGHGNWYWQTMTGAESGTNQFNPIVVNWWDMDWAIEYTDPLTKITNRIAPRDGIRPCKNKEEIAKYGPYWSPWLEDQYKGLEADGEAWKFEQEILASFIGSGNTVLSKEVIKYIASTVKDPVQKVKGVQTHVNPVTGEQSELVFDFLEPEEGLWIWETPVLATPEKRRGKEIVEAGTSAHSYVMGADIATGKGRDYSTIEIFDVDTKRQVAEFMARCLPREFVKYIDRIGRYYNCALAVVERNNGGDIVIDMLRHGMMYPRLWRKKDINDKPQAPSSRSKRRQRALKVGTYGFMTTSASKALMNKFLIDYLRDNDEYYQIFSKRLLKQLQTYVRKRDRAGHDTAKTEAEDGGANFDDLVMATGLGLLGTTDAFIIDAGNLIPSASGNGDFKSNKGPIILSDLSRAELQKEYMAIGGPSLMIPMSMSPSDAVETAAMRQLDQFTLSLGAIPISQGKPIITPTKWFFERR